MSTKVIVWIIVILVVLAGIWYFWSMSSSSSTATPTTPTTETAPTSNTAAQPNTAATQVQTSGNLSSGSSDQDLNADLTQIDTQTQAANSDSASVDQSFNDQPVPQAQ